MPDPLSPRTVPLAEFDSAPTTPSLSRDNSASGLSEFLIELSVAMHKHGIYPPGHPLLGQAVDRIHDALVNLLIDRSVLSIGIARRQLIIEGVASPANHPLLSELAGKLHRHHIGALKFIRGLTRPELADALGTIGIEPQRGEQPLGMRDEYLDARWKRVKLFPLRFDRLQLLDDEPTTPDSAPADSRAAQLWIGLAQAAVAADTQQEAPDARQLDPTRVALAIDEHDREPAYDQVIVGYLLQIVDHVRESPETANAGLARRISNLVGSLKPATLQRLLEMGGDNLQRRKFVVDAAQGMSVDAVVELVQAAATTEGQTISHSLLRMLTKLAHHATESASARNAAADGAFREHIARLVSSWSLTDPNPAAYSAALEQMSRANNSAATNDAEARFACEPSRLVAMALELDVYGNNVARSVDALLGAGQCVLVLDLLDGAPAHNTIVANEICRAIVAHNPLRVLLAAPRLDHALVERLVARCGTETVPALLDALDNAPEGPRRERIVTLLSGLGGVITDLVTKRLANAQPAIARELLALLTRLTPRTIPSHVRSFLKHADASVRREAAKLMLSNPDTRDTAMLAAVRDDDERVVSTALIASLNGCSAFAAATIRQRMERGDFTDSTTRTAAVRAVAQLADADTLEWLVRRVTVSGGLWRRPRLAPTSPEMLAALSILAVRWSGDPRAAQVVEQARSSASASVRAAAHGGRTTIEREAVR